MCAEQEAELARSETENIGRIGDLARRIDDAPELSRRRFIGGLGAISILTSLQGVAALVKMGNAEPAQAVELLRSSDICPDIRACLDEPTYTKPIATAATESFIEAAPTTSTIPGAPTTTIAEQIGSEVLSAAGLTNGQIEDATNCSFEIFSSRECILPARMPQHVPFKRLDSTNQEEVNSIYELLDAVELSPERYQNFKIDTSRASRLQEIVSGQAVWPSLNVNHWVGYPELTTNIDEYIDRMKRSGLSYTFLAMENGAMSLIAPAPHSLVSHAKFANHDSMGVAASANSIGTLQPEMLETMIYTELWGDKEYGRPLTRENSRSHAEVVRGDDVTKIDWPSQLQDGFYARKLELNHRVYALGQGGHPSPLAA